MTSPAWSSSFTRSETVEGASFKVRASWAREIVASVATSASNSMAGSLMVAAGGRVSLPWSAVV